MNDTPLNDMPNKPRIIVIIRLDPKKDNKKKAHPLPTDEPMQCYQH